MAESEFNEQFFSQFLDDYFAEADEHLRSVRRHLLEFEDSLNAGEAIDEVQTSIDAHDPDATLAHDDQLDADLDDA